MWPTAGFASALIRPGTLLTTVVGGDGGDGGDGGAGGGEGHDGGAGGGGGARGKRGKRGPQSVQSVPRAQLRNWEPGPPSSQSASEAQLHVSVQVVCSSRRWLGTRDTEATLPKIGGYGSSCIPPTGW